MKTYGNIKRATTKLAVAIAAITMAGGAWADTSTMAVTANIAGQCSVGNGLTMAFGALDVITTDGTQTTTDELGTATFPAICANGTSAPLFAYASANVASCTAKFCLKGATVTTDIIEYTLHPSANGSLALIAAATATAHPEFSANGVSQDLNLSGNIAAANLAAMNVQSYADTITITSTFTP